MSPPRYRTLDGDEVELPLAMDQWVFVPRALARFDPELAWALDYEDAPVPEDADARLDFSAGALLVPVARWNEHAELEPNLGLCSWASTNGPARVPVPPTSDASARPSSGDAPSPPGLRLATVAARPTVFALAALASAYVVAVGAWLWSLGDGIRGSDVSMGCCWSAWSCFLRGSPASLAPDGAARRLRRDRRGGCPSWVSLSC